MATFQINDDEWYALNGLPHLAREVYFVLRRYMDFETGITGIKRKVSLKAITEELYIEPHQGIKEEQPTERQIRRALDWLEKAGLIERDKASNKLNKQSIFKLILATRDYSVQNKAVSKWSDEAVNKRSKPEDNNANDLNGSDNPKVDNSKTQKAVIPPISDIKKDISKDISKKSKFDPLNFKPENVSEISWSEFVDHRKRSKSPLTAAAVTKLTNKIKDFSIEETSAAIDASIINGWRDLFPKKIGNDYANTNESRNSNGKRNKSLIERADEELARWEFEQREKRELASFDDSDFPY